MAHAQHEYYIRGASETEARGPFTFAQIAMLADQGEIDATTLYFDATDEQWFPLAGSAELGVVLLKKNVRLHKASDAHSEPKPTGSVSCAWVVVLLVASAAAFLLAAFLEARTERPLGANVFLWLGFGDILLALGVCGVGARIFTLVRMRAALGLGFLAVLFWLQADEPFVASAVVVSVSLWLATTLLTRRVCIINATAGLAGLVALTYCLLK